MSIPRTKSRSIVGDGEPFLWRVRSRPTYSQGNAWSPLAVAVEHRDSRRVLVLVFAGARPDNSTGKAVEVATPATVASAIRKAVAAGWRHSGKGGPAFFGVTSGRLGSSMQTVADQDVPTSQAGRDWQPYDPNWLVGLAKDQHPEAPWLPRALNDCRRARPGTRAYVYFVDPQAPAWCFQGSIALESPEHGSLVLDILEGQVVGGIEFLNRL